MVCLSPKTGNIPKHMLAPSSHGIYNHLLKGAFDRTDETEWASDMAADRYSKEMSLTLVTLGFSQLCPQSTALGTGGS